MFSACSRLVQKSVYYQVFLLMEQTPLAQPNIMQISRNAKLCEFLTSETPQKYRAIFVSAKDFESLSLESIQVTLVGTQC